MYIGPGFRELYADPQLETDLRESWLPWLLDGCGPAGDPPVELGADIGVLAGGPALRLPPARASVRVRTLELVDADPRRLPWPDGALSAVVALLALHHLPDIEAQDAALAEWARVLRPGGVLVGLNPIDGPHLRRLDTERRCHPIDPMTFGERLARAGLPHNLVRVWSLVGFTARGGPR